MGQMVYSLLRLSDELSRRLMLVLADIAAGLDTARRELVRIARDIGFKLYLFGYTLSRIALGLSPGLGLVVFGLLLGWPWVWLLGAAVSVGLMAWAMTIQHATGRDTEDDRIVAWASFFPPSWLDRPALRSELGAVVRAWLRADDALRACLAGIELRNPARRVLVSVRDAGHKRMHRLRAEVSRSLTTRRGAGYLPGSVDQTRQELERVPEALAQLDRYLHPPTDAPAELPPSSDDTLGHAVTLLEELQRALGAMDRHR